MRAALPAALQPVVTFAYLTGWRIPSEVLTLEGRQVDFASGIVRLDVGTTKNRDGRVFPFDVLPELKELLERQRDTTRQVERECGQIVTWVFHRRRGKPVRDFRDAWARPARWRATRRASLTTSDGPPSATWSGLECLSTSP